MDIGYVDILNVKIGSESQDAVHVCINNKWHWIPFSQMTRMTKNPQAEGQDSIRIAKWLADKIKEGHG